MLIANYVRIDLLILLCSRSAQCILLQKETNSKILFPILPTNMYPVFPDKSTISFPTKSIFRLQISITLEFHSQTTRFKKPNSHLLLSIQSIKVKA